MQRKNNERLSKAKPDIQCLASFIIIPFHRPKITLV